MVHKDSGLILQPEAKSKTAPAIFEAIHKEIQLTFNAFGNHISILHGDTENINQAIRIPFSKVGTNIVLSLPGDHAPTAEQATKTIQNRARYRITYQSN
jgi:hypothetical protein